MFRKSISSLCRNRCGLVLVAGAISLLTGIEQVFSAGGFGSKPRSFRAMPRRPRLKITRTQSELGYVYWVLRDSSATPIYALFDTWQEAMGEAARRVDAQIVTSLGQGSGRDLVPA